MPRAKVGGGTSCFSIKLATKIPPTFLRNGMISRRNTKISEVTAPLLSGKLINL
jgi:hypothetical protein